MKRRLLILLLASLVSIGLSAARPTLAAADNAAIAVNTKDGTTVFKVAFAIRHVMSDVVTETNAAVAYNSCTDCASVAIAFEIVLIESDASVISPTNVAIAFNENCSTCVAVAEAYQFVLGTGGGAVHFDAEGNRILAELRRRLRALRKEDLTIDQLQTILDDMSAQIADVLANHLVSVGPSKPQETTTAATTSTTTPTTTETTPTTTEETTPTTESTPTTTAEVTTTTGP
ncbi:MAG: putative peptide zinc metalloprotease protein [Gaiellaceae bacterium]|jgi:putative peptide zinc metalloprotease protein|nr:putative peptide zinc metalloprotease protein [Gaiellaceae bacterium]